MTAPRKTRTPRKIAAVDEAATAPDPESAGTVADLAEILPDPARLTISGLPVRVRRFATRELMATVRVLTTGMGAGIANLDLNGTRDEQLSVLYGLLITAIPDAGDEFIQLLGMIVEPVNKTDAVAVQALMLNPPLEVTMDILAVAFMQERDDLSALVGKGRQLFAHLQALYRTGKRGT